MMRFPRSCLTVLGFSPAVFLLVAGTAGAGTQDQVKLALHVQAHAAKASLICVPVESGGAAPTQLPCRDFTTAGDLGTGYDVYLVAANGYVDQFDQPGIGGISCGIDYDEDAGSGVDVFGWSQCADGLPFDATGPNGPWPAAGSGLRLTWLTCSHPVVGPAGEQAVAGAFYVYAYSPDRFQVTENRPLDSGPELLVADCGGAESSLIPEAAGRVDFSAGSTDPGYNPCPSAYLPRCSVPAAALRLGNAPLGSYRDYPITIGNTGYPESGPVVGTAHVDCPGFQIVSGADYDLSEPGTTHTVMVRFTPTSTAVVDCVLDLGSTCHDIDLEAAGDYLPRFAAVPDAVDMSVNAGTAGSVRVTVSNDGSAGLSWDSVVQYGTLEDVRAGLDAGYAAITAHVPDLYLFSGGDTGDRLTDYNMTVPFVGFNLLYTNVDFAPGLRARGPLPYTGGSIVASDALGPGGRYFTRKYPGLFVLVADVSSINRFYTAGLLKGGPTRPVATGAVISTVGGVDYVGYYRQISGGTAPSLNHMIVVAGDPHVFHWLPSPWPSDDVDGLQNAQELTRLYYVVTMSQGGAALDLAGTQAMLEAFAQAAHPASSWLSILPRSGAGAPGVTSEIELSVDTGVLTAGAYAAHAVFRSNDPAERAHLIPVRLTVVEPPPALELAATGFTAAALPGGETTKSLDIGNTGVGPLTFELTSPQAWIHPDPASGTVPPGGSATIRVTFSADGLDPGDDEGELTLRTNDPDHVETALPIMLHVGSLDPAVAEVGPESLNPGSKGRWVTARIELPAGYDPARVDPATVRILGSVPVDDGGAVPGDFNRNGVPDWTFKFPRSAFVMALPPADDVMVPVIGEVRDLIWFETEQPVHVLRPHVLSPNGGETYGAGAWTTLRWSVPDGWDPASFSLSYSPDGGATWTPVADGITGADFVWRLPDEPAETAAIRVQAFDEDGVIGYDVSDAPFAVVASATGIDETGVPASLVLGQNTPNPFRGSTVIPFALPTEGSVDLRVYDVFGRGVRTLLVGISGAGAGQASWDGRDRAGIRVAPGVYFYRLRTDSGTITRRMFLLP